jgi:hypothetical protein
VSLRPGGLLWVRPPILRHLGWSPQTDTFLYEWEGRRVTVFKKPTERQWRIERLRTRLDPQHPIPSPGCAPRTLAEFRALKRFIWKPAWMIDVVMPPIAPVHGNVFEKPERALEKNDVLLAEAVRLVEEALARRNDPCN